MLTIHLDLINHKLLSKLRIYENIWSKDSVAIQSVFWFLQYRTRPVGIPHASGIRKTETLALCPCPYRTRPIVISDTFDRCRTEANNPLLVILHFSDSIYFMPCISTNKLLHQRAIKSIIWQNKILFNQPLSIFHKYAYL